MSVDVETVELKPHIAAIIAEVGLDNLSAKTVRESVESKLGLEAGALKPRKKDIADLIDAVINEQDAGGGGDDADDAEDDDDDEAPPPSKKAKAEPKPAGDKPKTTCKTKSGAEPPKNLKREQEGLKMTASKFLQLAQTLEVDICGNKLTGEPRSFSSDNKGWYLNGKIEVPVGDETVWAQVGLNITIPGSNQWR
jgi:hypothetical protein